MKTPFGDISLPSGLRYDPHRPEHGQIEVGTTDGYEYQWFGFSVEPSDEAIESFNPIYVSDRLTKFNDPLISEYPTGGLVTIDSLYPEIADSVTEEDTNAVFVLTTPFKKKSTTDNGNLIQKFELVKFGEPEKRLFAYCPSPSDTIGVRVGTMRSSFPTGLSPVPDEAILKNLFPKFFISNNI